MFWIFKTEKAENPADETTVFAGQLNSVELPKVSAATKKMTGESPTHITKHDIGTTAVTPSFFVDFIDRDNFGGKLPL